MLNKNIRVRFAPSPTGHLHIGGVRTALYNYIFAKKYNGKFILRIEDTDRKRSKSLYSECIIKSLEWLGFDWDEEPIFQNDRLDIYSSYAEKLVKEKKAYYCYCTWEDIAKQKEEAKAKGVSYKYNGNCKKFMGKEEEMGNKPHTIRIINDVEKDYKINDLIRGEITNNAREFDDFIIMKSDGTPTYSFACVIDDHLLNISHVIRGEDHITNTFKQLLLYEKIKWQPPEFAHLPLINGPDGKRLSKRHGATALLEFKKLGIIKDAFINYLALLGWNPGDDKEIFSMAEMIDKFDIGNISKKAAQFDYDKLTWMNGEYLFKMDIEEKYRLMKAYIDEYIKVPINDEKLRKILSIMGPRGKTLKEIWELIKFVFVKPTEYEKIIRADYAEQLIKLFEGLQFNLDNISEGMRKFCNDNGLKLKKVSEFIRLSLTGRQISIGLFESIYILGREETIKRIRRYENDA